MKVVAHAGGRAWRGSEEILGLILVGLRERGHEVACSVVAGSEVEDRFRGLGVRTTGIRPRGDLDVWSAWRFRRWLAREAPDALLLPDWRRLPWAAWAGKGAGVPRVVARVGLRKELPGGGLRRRAMLRYVDVWYVNAEESARALVASAPELAGRVEVVPNGVPIDRPAEAHDLRHELGVPDVAFLALAAGAVAPRKGFDVLVRAVAAVRAGGDSVRGAPADAAVDVHVAIAGDTALADPVRALASEMGVADRVHLLGHRDDLPRLFGGADLFVLSSRNEGSPLVLLEAIAGGAPAVVATRVGGVERILGGAGEVAGTDAVTEAGSAAVAGGAPPVRGAGPGGPEPSGVERLPTGWIVPPGDVRALARALADAAKLERDDPGAYRSLGVAARERVARHFSVDAMVAGVEALLFG